MTVKRNTSGQFQPGTAPGPGRPKRRHQPPPHDLATLAQLAIPPTADELAALELDYRELLARAATPPQQIESLVARFHASRLSVLRAAQLALEQLTTSIGNGVDTPR